jgi:hypothetical protein
MVGRKEGTVRRPKNKGPAVSEDELANAITRAVAKGSAEDEELLKKHKDAPTPTNFVAMQHSDDHLGEDDEDDDG